MSNPPSKSIAHDSGGADWRRPRFCADALNHNSCRFLAADFDGDAWKDNISLYREVGSGADVTIAVERSRSGRDPPAAGNTVMGYALIARHRTSTRVLGPAARTHLDATTFLFG
jgi:hypothetical protein